MDFFIYINRLSTDAAMPQIQVFLQEVTGFARLCRPVIHRINIIHRGRNGRIGPIFFFKKMWYAMERVKMGRGIP